MAAVEVGRDGLAQGREAVGGGVAVGAVAQGLHAGLDDVFRRAEVGLADAEIDDVVAFGGEFLGAGQHLEGALGAEAGERGGGLEHGDFPVCGCIHPVFLPYSSCTYNLQQRGMREPEG